MARKNSTPAVVGNLMINKVWISDDKAKNPGAITWMKMELTPVHKSLATFTPKTKETKKSVILTSKQTSQNF